VDAAHFLEFLNIKRFAGAIELARELAAHRREDPEVAGIVARDRRIGVRVGEVATVAYDDWARNGTCVMVEIADHDAQMAIVRRNRPAPDKKRLACIGGRDGI